LLTEENGQGRLLRLLMPLTGPLEMHGWQQRIDRILHEQLGRNLAALGLELVARELRGRETLAELLGEPRGNEG